MRAFPLMLLVPCLAFAQGKTLKDKEEIKFNEIERGFTIGTAAGFWALFNSPSYPNGTRPVATGQTIRLDIGLDIGERVVAGIMLQASNNRPTSGSGYLGTIDPSGTMSSGASGDYAQLLPGVGVKVNIVGFDDSQDVKRLWVYARVAAAAGLYFPHNLIDKFDVMLQGGAGVEYYTKLRHFAIGFEANVVFMALTTTIGLSVTPTLRYSF
jgi:hypothetical protein